MAVTVQSASKAGGTNPNAAQASKQPQQAQEPVYLYVDSLNTKASRSIGVFKMSEDAIKSLSRGHKLNVWIDGDTSETCKLLKPKLTLRAMSAFIPAVGQAVREHKEAGGQFITDIVFRKHFATTYNKIFGWIWTCIGEGHVVRPVRVEKNAMRTYKDVAKVADELGIGFMVKAMDSRISQMEASTAVRSGTVSLPIISVAA